MARKHGSAEVNKLFKELQRLGFRVERAKRTFVIFPPDSMPDKPKYKTHGTPQAVKAIYSDFRKIYGVELDPKWRAQ
jgi:hypothetical protein